MVDPFETEVVAVSAIAYVQVEEGSCKSTRLSRGWHSMFRQFRRCLDRGRRNNLNRDMLVSIVARVATIDKFQT